MNEMPGGQVLEPGRSEKLAIAVGYIQPRTNESRSWLNPCNPYRYVIDIENCTRMIMRGTIESRNERVVCGGRRVGGGGEEGEKAASASTTSFLDQKRLCC